MNELEELKPCDSYPFCEHSNCETIAERDELEELTIFVLEQASEIDRLKQQLIERTAQVERLKAGIIKQFELDLKHAPAKLKELARVERLAGIPALTDEEIDAEYADYTWMDFIRDCTGLEDVVKRDTPSPDFASKVLRLARAGIGVVNNPAFSGVCDEDCILMEAAQAFAPEERQWLIGGMK